MKLVLLSGGSGVRLWPLSSGVNSKQFLQVLSGEHGKIESMLQRTLRQLDGQGLLEQTYICTIKEQLPILKQQVKGLCDRIIVEPSRRDTFAAVALSSCYLYDRGLVDLDEVIAVCSVDLYVEGAFYEAVQAAAKLVQDTTLDLSMIGIKPTYPSEKYGYISPQVASQGAMPVAAFVEKPTSEYAEQLITEGALWNSSFYAFRMSFMRDYLASHQFPTTYEQFRKEYEHLPKRSFDYEVSEHVKSAKVWPYHGLWNDMGAWDTLVEVVDERLFTKVDVICEDCSNVHVINQLGLTISFSGQSDIVVIACSGGILVTDKSLSSTIKDHANRIIAADADTHEQTDNLTIITENCKEVRAVNKSGLPLLVVGLQNTEIFCDKERLSIRAV